MFCAAARAADRSAGKARRHLDLHAAGAWDEEEAVRPVDRVHRLARLGERLLLRLGARRADRSVGRLRERRRADQPFALRAGIRLLVCGQAGAGHRAQDPDAVGGRRMRAEEAERASAAWSGLMTYIGATARLTLVIWPAVRSIFSSAEASPSG